MACAAAPIIGGPRPPPAQRRTPPTPPKNPIGPAHHTLKCEEPRKTQHSTSFPAIDGSITTIWPRLVIS